MSENPAFQLLNLLLAEKTACASREQPYVIAIDGRCGSGKTTLATQLSERFGTNLIHMDDFFLRPEQRTPERLATPGENIDHERFLSEVLLPLKQGSVFSYRPFSCGTQSLGDPITVEPKPITLIEGSYALHPMLRQHYDYTVFLSVDPVTQEKRIRNRNGDRAWTVFRDRWIPMEEKYISHCDILNAADSVITCPQIISKA